MGEKYFQNALHNFTKDVANGGAIRHLWNVGYSVSQIIKQLDYPANFEAVQNVVWEHLLSSGVISLEEPENPKEQTEVSYVKEYDKYGRTSFRRVVEIRASKEETSYIPCDFGLMMAEDKEMYQNMLNCLDERQREYIMDIPWKRQRVYHRANQQMREIAERLEASGLGTTRE